MSNKGNSRPKEHKIRVLVAKPGLDGHDRGAKVIARALREAGMEVIYTGLRQSPEMIVEAALQEDVDVVGLSILSGAHMELFPLILDGLKEKGLDHVLVVAGGIIPEEDVPVLKKLGVEAIFRPGAMTQDIVDFINGAMASRKKNGA
jgi:methylmalonyl-CoA mutase C-terminal domain/subunit